jgi:DNA-binding response OmpR family regulator
MEQRRRILIVDDTVINVSILVRLLRKDYDLQTAASGEECLSVLPAFDPQLVLLDIMMPGINGYETCRRIKSSALGEFMRVILVSGNGSTADQAKGFDALADDYLVKPFKHDVLLSKVREQLCLGEAQRQLIVSKEPLEIVSTSCGA